MFLVFDIFTTWLLYFNRCMSSDDDHQWSSSLRGSPSGSSKKTPVAWKGEHKKCGTSARLWKQISSVNAHLRRDDEGTLITSKSGLLPTPGKLKGVHNDAFIHRRYENIQGYALSCIRLLLWRISPIWNIWALAEDASRAWSCAASLWFEWNENKVTRAAHNVQTHVQCGFQQAGTIWRARIACFQMLNWLFINHDATLTNNPLRAFY